MELKMVRENIEIIAKLIDKNATVVELENDSGFRVFLIKTEYPQFCIGKNGRVVNSIRTIIRSIHRDEKVFIEVTT
jgi:predicted RNA-binding protein YlqC (UPF0109 family)